MSQYPILYLRKREDKRLRIGHPWVFSNEVDIQRSPLKSFSAGQTVEIRDAADNALALGYVNSASLICARVLTRDTETEINQGWLEQQLQTALTLREKCYSSPYYRLSFGEGDGLPGVIIDRYDNVLVIQLTTAGAELWKDDLAAALDSLLSPVALIWRNDSGSRELEGLPLYSETTGSAPETLAVTEGNTTWNLDLTEGQKTGWFYDQRPNRERFKRYADFYRGGQVLDIYSYVGAWAMAAAEAGADEVICVDRSKSALAIAAETATKHDVTMHCLLGDAPETLGGMVNDGVQFDAVVIDPPALIKSRKAIKAGIAHYSQVNHQAMKLVKPGGLFVSASCSYHLASDELRKLLVKSAARLGRGLQILEYSELGPDHPVHPALPEMRYLKAYFCRLL